MAQLSYEFYKLLEEEVGKEKAEKLTRLFEEIVREIQQEPREQKPIIKAELKDELTKELTTKGDLVILKSEVYRHIEAVKAELEKKIEAVEYKLEKRMDRLEMYLKVLIALVVLGLTLLNPAFSELVRTIFLGK
jgi:biopolymer transport protein ExbB/TolQ